MKKLLFIAIIVVKSDFDYYVQVALRENPIFCFYTNNTFLHILSLTSLILLLEKPLFLHLWSQKLGGSIFI